MNTVCSVCFLLIVNGSLAQYRTFVGKQREEFQDYISTNEMLGQRTDVSRIRCLELCYTHDACISAFYNSKLKQCQLHAQLLRRSVVTSSPRPGVKYYVTGGCPAWAHGYKFYKQLDVCYRIFTGDYPTWWEARQACTAEKGHLMVVRDHSHWTKIRDEIEASQTLLAVSMYYIDGYDSFGDRIFRDHNDVPLPWIQWARGEPNNLFYSEYCLSLYGEESPAWYMNDYSCDNNLFNTGGYICEIDARF